MLPDAQSTSDTAPPPQFRAEALALKAILKASVDNIYVVGKDGRYQYVSAGGAAVLGLAPEQLTGKHWRELGLPADTMETFDAQRERAFATGRPVIEQTRFVSPDGVERYFEYIVTAIEGEDGVSDAVVVVSRDVTGRQRSEAALRHTRALFDAVIDHAPACIFAKDRDGRYIVANHSLAKLVGREQHEFLGKTDYDFFPAEIARQFGEDDQAIILSGAPRTYEESFVQDGKLRTYLTVKFPLRDENGEAFAACAVATEITDLRRVQEALQSSEERLRLALEAGRMGVWDLDIRSGRLDWSENLERLFGLAPGTFEGTLDAFEALVHPDDLPFVRQKVKQAILQRDRYDVEYRIKRPDGLIRWIAAKGEVFTDPQERTRFLGVGLDITRQKRSERDARFVADAGASLAGLVDYESTLQLVARQAVPSFADWCAVDMLDDAGNLRRLAVAHVDPAKVDLAHALHRRYPPDPEAPTGVWNVLRTGKSEWIAEITDELLQQSIGDAELLSIMRELGLRSYLGVPLIVRGRALGVITFIAAESGRIYDEDDLRLAEDLANRAAVSIDNAQLYQAVREADRRKDEFLALLGHELRNPLAPIRTALGVLKLPGADAAIAQRARETMERQVEHLVRLVDDLLDVSRIMRGQVELREERLEMAAVIARAVETSQPLISSEGHTLEIELQPQPLWVSGDLVRLAQVLSNLLNNAAKYMDRGGHIRLTATQEEGQAIIRVRDTGIGIAPELLPRLFDMFFQAERRTRQSQGGLGIGLSLVRALVELHGGTVEALSPGVGLGSEFVVRLPLLPAEPTAPDAVASNAAPTTLAARKVLVVDDNVDAADTLGLLLELQGQEVIVAYDGKSALAKATADPPSIGFLDLGMPHMDGYELARAIRSIDALKGITLVALTGWGQPEDRRRTQEAGFDHHLVKPVEPEALRKLLGES